MEHSSNMKSSNSFKEIFDLTGAKVVTFFLLAKYYLIFLLSSCQKGVDNFMKMVLEMRC